MKSIFKRFIKLAGLLSIYWFVTQVTLLKGFEDIGNRINAISSNEVQIIEIPRTTIEYREIEAEMTDEAFMNHYMSYQDKTNTEEWFRGYKEIMRNLENPPATIYDIYTLEEITLLCQMVQTEIGNGDFDSKTRIASVVFNRIDSDEFPNTITAVIKAPSQFAYSNTRIDETTVLACEYVFMFGDTADGAVAFHSGKSTETFFGRHNLHLEDPWHSFYK